MKIEIDDDLADKVIVASLTRHAGYAKGNIINGMRDYMTTGKQHHMTDCLDGIKDLKAMNRVLKYYGGKPVPFPGNE